MTSRAVSHLRLLVVKSLSKIHHYYWNSQPGVFVSEQAWVRSSAKIRMDGDLFISGGKVHIASGVKICDGVIIEPYGGSVIIKENVYVGPYCVLYGHGGLTIGANTLIASHTVIIPANHKSDQGKIPIRFQGETRLGIEIGEDVWIGCGVSILDGVSIGRGSVIGAGSVVTKSITEYSIAVGVPAKIIGSRQVEL